MKSNSTRDLTAVGQYSLQIEHPGVAATSRVELTDLAVASRESRVTALPAMQMQRQVALLSSMPIDFIAKGCGPASGSKHPATISMQVGGLAASGARVAAALGLGCTVVGAQHATLGAVCREVLGRMGARALLLTRQNETAAMTLGVPGLEGEMELWIQRSSPLTPRDLGGRVNRALRGAALTVVGPIAEINRRTAALYRRVRSAARYVAIVPHPNLLQDGATLSAVVPWCDFICLNYWEAQLLAPTVSDVDLLALRVRRVCGNGAIAFALTNAGGRGWLWDCYDGCFSWTEIVPPRVRVVNDVGAGDTFTVAYACLRQVFGYPPVAALKGAVAAAAAHVSGRPLVSAGVATALSSGSGLWTGSASKGAAWAGAGI